MKMTKKELKAVCDSLITDFPKAKHGSIIGYEFADNFYLADVLEEPGDYYIVEKIPLERNKTKISQIRKGLDYYVKHKGKSTS